MVALFMHPTGCQKSIEPDTSRAGPPAGLADHAHRNLTAHAAHRIACPDLPGTTNDHSPRAFQALQGDHRPPCSEAPATKLATAHKL